MLDRLAPVFFHWTKRLEAEGFQPIRKAWTARAVGIGRDITARLPNATYTGVFDGIDDTGALILSTPDERLVLAAGDVYFGQT